MTMTRILATLLAVGFLAACEAPGMMKGDEATLDQDLDGDGIIDGDTVGTNGT